MKANVSKKSILEILIPVKDYLESKEEENQEIFEKEYQEWKELTLAEFRERVRISEEYDKEYEVWKSRRFIKGKEPAKPLNYVSICNRDDIYAQYPSWSWKPCNFLLMDLKRVRKLIFNYSLAEEYELTNEEVDELYYMKTLLNSYGNI